MWHVRWCLTNTLMLWLGQEDRAMQTEVAGRSISIQTEGTVGSAPGVEDGFYWVPDFFSGLLCPQESDQLCEPNRQKRHDKTCKSEGLKKA